MPLLTDRRNKAQRDSERGSSPISFMMIFVIVLLVAELVVVGGRIAGAHAAVANAARVAARQGTLVQSQQQVAPVVASAASQNLESNGQNCEPFAALPVGQTFSASGWVEVTVTCTVKLSDLSALGLPLPDVAITKTHKEIVETYRAIGVVNS